MQQADRASPRMLPGPGLAASAPLKEKSKPEKSKALPQAHEAGFTGGSPGFPTDGLLSPHLGAPPAFLSPLLGFPMLPSWALWPQLAIFHHDWKMLPPVVQ